jgi:hypothetical protein
LLILPPIAFVITRLVCISLRDRPGPERTERRVPIERSASGGYGVPYDDPEVDWMLEGGAAPGHFDEITEPSAVRGPAGDDRGDGDGPDTSATTDGADVDAADVDAGTVS